MDKLENLNNYMDDPTEKKSSVNRIEQHTLKKQILINVYLIYQTFPISKIFTLENGEKFADGILIENWKLISEHFKIK